MIILILTLAFILRLINISQSLWLDEAIEIVNVSSHNLKYLYLNYSLGDFHPPLYHLFLRLWLYILPTSELFARLPSVVFGTLGVYLTYLIASKLYDKKTGIIAALLLATAPLHIYYSQEARMYMLAAFLASASIYFFISLLANDKIYLWVGFIISTTLMLYSDYLPYLLLPVYVLFLYIFRKKIPKHTIRSFIPAIFLVLIFLIPWLLIFPKQLNVGISASVASPAWAQVVGSPSFKNLFLTFVKFTIGRISNDNNTIYFLLFLPAAFFVASTFIVSTFRMSRRRAFLLLWFFVPIILSFCLSYIVPIYSYFRLLFVLPAFYIIWASAINTVNIKKVTSAFLTLALAINITSLAIYHLNPKFHRENWKGAVAYVQEKSSVQTISLFESNSPFTPFDYYNKNKVEAYGALESFDAQKDDSSQKLEGLTKERNHLFLFQYLAPITDPTGIVFERLIGMGFKNVSTRDFNGVGFVYEFKR